MKNIAYGALVLAALGLAGCNDYTSPEGVVGTAAKALKKENLKVFKRTLTGEAKKQYGNLQGMAALARELEGKKPTLQPGSKTCTDPVQEREYVKKFSCELTVIDAGSRAPLKGVTTVCTSIRESYHYGPGEPCYGGYRRIGCTPGEYFEPRWNTTCQISEIR